MPDTYILDSRNAALLTEGVARHYGNIRELALVLDGETTSLTVRVNGQNAAEVTYIVAEDDPVERLMALRAAYYNGGRDTVSLEEVMALLEPAHQRLSG